MKQYEYKIVTPVDRVLSFDDLKHLGDDCWELASVLRMEHFSSIQILYYFKREKSNQEDL